METLTSILEAYHQLFTEYPLLFIALVSLFGLLIGSFLNVVAIRVPKGESIIHPPSHCSACKHQLTAIDLIPVFSYLYLQGKCRHCRTSFSYKYALFECLTAILFGISAWFFGMSLDLIVALFITSILLIIFQTDLAEMIIPDRIILFGVIIGALLRLWIHPLPLWHYGLGLLAGGGVLYIIAVLSQLLLRKEGMGGGDIKLFGFIGLIVGFKLTLFTLFAASLLGTLFGIALMVAGKYRRGRYIPFGPFIAAGAFLSYLWGDSILSWYFGLLI
jgi:leader peptidase (prepilin peptidase) / N-methyltransferase